MPQTAVSMLFSVGTFFYRDGVKFSYQFSRLQYETDLRKRSPYKLRAMRPRKVLVIDDEKDLCHLIKSFLGQQSYEVHTAFSLGEGLQMAKTYTPDILIMDNNLPDGLGWENIGVLQSILPQAKIILISAYKIPSEKILHNVSILEKPISLLKLQHHL
jgi:CheY-like chemotaxis protein